MIILLLFIFLGITDGHPSGVDLVLLSFTPGKTGATGWPALRAGPGVVVINPGQNRGYWRASPPGWLFSLPFSSPGSIGTTEKAALKVGLVLLSLSSSASTGLTGRSVLNAGVSSLRH